MMTKACYRAKRENLATSVYNIAWQWISCQTHVCGRELYEFMSIAKTIIKVYMTSRADVLPQAAADGVFNQVARLTSRYLSQPHGLRDPAEERQVESRLYSVYQIQMCLYACRGQTGKVKRLIYVMRARRRKHGLTIGEQLYLPLFKAYRVRYSKRTGEPFETRLSGQRGWSHRKQVGRECTRYFQQMVGVDGVEPSNEGLRVYLEALAALGQLEQVLKVYDILRSQLREKEDEEGQQQQQQRCAEDRQRVSLVNDGAMVAVHRAFLNWSWHGKSSMADVVFERYPEILEYLQKQKTGGLKGKPRRPGANETAAMSDGALEEYFDTWFCAGRFAADNKTERLDGVSKGDQQLGTTPGTMCGQQRERRSSSARYQEDPPPDLKYRLIRLVSARMVSLSSTLPVDPHPNKEEAPESRLTQVIRWTTLGNRADHFKFLSSFEYYTPVIPNIYILNSYLTARINLLRQEAVTTVTTDVDIGIFRHREILGLWRFVRYLLETVYGSGAMGGNSSGISHGCDAMVWPLVPDTYSISMLIDACTKYGEWQLGQEIWDHISAALSPQQSPRAVAMEGGRRKAESRGGVPTTELPAELARQAQQASIAKIGLFHAYLRFHLRQLGLHNDKHGHPTLRSREELQQSWNFIRKIKEMLRQMDEMGTPITTFFICKLVHHLLELEYCIQQLHQQQQSCDHPQGAGVLTEEIGDLIESLKQWQFNREKVAVSAKGSLVRYLEQRLPPSVINHQHHLNVFLTGVSDVQRDNLLHDDMHAY
ncbi:hypothetical protein EV182_002509 [Spiromyces aspiralis]|uniref:Uncharacterized protein n=1 Tax=Spiromyces aspiralis TaxID=68401 RepID=A0ACC1HHI3_9FUNG|nr:hypothetical protein EV182_002509 [Spiromyces aspiralis]